MCSLLPLPKTGQGPGQFAARCRTEDQQEQDHSQPVRCMFCEGDSALEMNPRACLDLQGQRGWTLDALSMGFWVFHPRTVFLQSVEDSMLHAGTACGNSHHILLKGLVLILSSSVSAAALPSVWFCFILSTQDIHCRERGREGERKTFRLLVHS